MTLRFDVSSPIAGPLFSCFLSIVQMVQYIVRHFADFGIAMYATERLHYYGLKRDSEAPLHLARIPRSWSGTGEITFSDVHMRYRPVLNAFRCTSRVVSTLGSLGVPCTGAEKSGIITTLSRLNEISCGTHKPMLPIKTLMLIFQPA